MKKNRLDYPQALPAGSILYGRYIIGRVLGQGGFGITYLARDHQTNWLVAIKEFFPSSMAGRSGTTVLPFSGLQGENFAYGRSTFLEEAKTMAQFNGHPNIAGVQLYFEENGTAYFVMEYLDGCSLGSYIASRGGRLSWAETASIMLPVLDVLGHIHAAGIVHRDVAPDNIFILKNGTVKLLDFGAARHSLGNVSQSLDVVIKHGFAPKEQYSRRGRQGPYTDVYAASATIYYALTGAKPDESLDRAEKDDMPPPTLLGAKISGHLEDVIMKGLSVEAKDRYQSAAELHHALTSDATAHTAAPSTSTTLNGTTKPQPPSQPKEPLIESTGKPKLTKKQLMLWGVGALAVLCLVLFLLFHTHSYGEWKVIRIATCEEDGLRERSCSCGNTETELIPAAGHTVVRDAGYPATFAEQGLSDGTHCSFCQKVLQPQTTIDLWSMPVLAAVTLNSDFEHDYFLGTSYATDTIRTVSFRNTTEDAPANAYDISHAGNRSVLCWMTGGDLIIAANGNVVANPDSSNLFQDCSNLRSIDFNGCFDTSNVTDMHAMFLGCDSLTSLDLSSFDTFYVTDMHAMFWRCDSLTSLDLSSFDTARVTAMRSMFYYCKSLTSLDLSSFDTALVRNMDDMFSNCELLTSLDLSSFDTARVTTMHSMFWFCESLTALDLSSFDTSHVTDVAYMFTGCVSLTTLISEDPQILAAYNAK